jgi:hypothetical protein
MELQRLPRVAAHDVSDFKRPRTGASGARGAVPMRRRHRRRRSTPLALAVLLAASAAPATAQGGGEEPERSPDTPFEIEDAFATRRGEGEISGGFRYRRGRGGGGRDTYEVAPQIQLGLPHRLELRATVEERFGNSEEARQGGAVRLGAFHQLN